MTLYTSFIETLVIAYTISEIFAQIYHKGPILTLKVTFWDNVPNLTFPTVKMTFRIVQSNPSFDSGSDRYHHKEVVCKELRKVVRQLLIKLPK